MARKLNTMKSFFDQESTCSLNFSHASQCWHVWTPEDHEIVFSCRADFEYGMNLLAICARLFPKVKIYTFQLMTNHLHIAASGSEEDIRALFEMFKRHLAKYLAAKGRNSDLSSFTINPRQLNTVDDLRNVIAYINRNGYVVDSRYTPYSYPWGANTAYFSPLAKEQLKGSRHLVLRDRRAIIHGHLADGLEELALYDGYVSPLSFCYVKEGESMFRDAAHYFYCISRNIETNKKIAADIGESIYYTDDELFAATCALSKNKFGSISLSLLSKEQKIELAKTLHYDYNAGNKQIARFLKLDRNLLSAMFHERS